MIAGKQGGDTAVLLQLAQSLKFKPSHDPIRGKQGGDTTVLQLRRLVSKWLKSSGPPTQIGIVRRCFT